MRRSDRPISRRRRWSLKLFPRAAPLPEPVYREFVDMLFGMRLPIFGMGLVFAGVAALAAWQWQDVAFALCAAGAAIVTVVRVAIIGAYLRARPIADLGTLHQWERRYAAGNYASAVLLALLNVRALGFHDPLLHMIAVSLVFSFGAGVVSRISVRPLICVVSLLLATVPTVAALALHAFTEEVVPLHAELFAIEAFLVAMITSLSLQTVAHLYRSSVVHHTAKHDLAQLATRDALTNLANRLLLRERFRSASAAALDAGTRLAVQFVDLDGFKGVNDGHGHLAGDAVLVEVAKRLEGAVRAEDTVARLGGDEFLVLQADVRHDGEAEMLARRIIKRLSAPYQVEGKEMRISASVGIATAPDFGLDLEQLIACADTALYRSKGAGKGRLCFFVPDDGAGSHAAAVSG